MKDEYAEAIMLHLEHIAACLSDIAKALESPVISPATNYTAPPKISPETPQQEELEEPADPTDFELLLRAKGVPDDIIKTLEFAGNTVSMTEFWKDRDMWTTVNNILKAEGLKYYKRPKQSGYWSV